MIKHAAGPVLPRTFRQHETSAMASLYHAALDDLRSVFDRLDDAAVDRCVETIMAARRIALYGVGREGLQMKGFCMRLFHLGRAVAMVGDMTTPPIGKGDLLIVSAGPGGFSTVLGLMEVAKNAGAKTVAVTAQPRGSAAQRADEVLVVPAQTMADDHGPSRSVLPMGSLFEGAQYILFEVMILKLRDRLGVTAEAMRANHTNLE